MAKKNKQRDDDEDVMEVEIEERPRKKKGKKGKKGKRAKAAAEPARTAAVEKMVKSAKRPAKKTKPAKAAKKGKGKKADTFIEPTPPMQSTGERLVPLLTKAKADGVLVKTAKSMAKGNWPSSKKLITLRDGVNEVARGAKASVANDLRRINRMVRWGQRYMVQVEAGLIQR